MAYLYRIQFIGHDYKRVHRTTYYKTREGFLRCWKKYLVEYGQKCKYMHGWKRTEHKDVYDRPYTGWLFLRLNDPDHELGEAILWDI